MISEFAAGVAGLKTVADLVTLVLKMNVDTAVTQKAIDANAAIINAQSLMLEWQSKHQELLAQKDQLEKRLIEIENWEAEAQNYSLTELGTGVFVYALKPDQTSTTPMHCLCPNCYQEKQKSILQVGEKGMGGTPYECLRCKSTLWVV